MWKAMSGDFPKLVTRGNKQMLQFSFPKFNGSVHYDPVIEMSDDLSSTTSKPPSTTPSKAWKTTTHFSIMLISLVVLLAEFVV